MLFGLLLLFGFVRIIRGFVDEYISGDERGVGELFVL